MEAVMGSAAADSVVIHNKQTFKVITHNVFH